MRLGRTLENRLADTREELARAREALRILDEQVAYQRGVVDEAETRAVVAATPLADRELREAGDDLRRLQRQHDEARARVAAVVAEQDALLDRMLHERTVRASSASTLAGAAGAAAATEVPPRRGER